MGKLHVTLRQCAVLCAALLLPGWCRAEAYGPADPLFLLPLASPFLGAACAVLCAIIEALYPRRRVAWTLAAAAGIAALLAGVAAFRAAPAQVSHLMLWLVVPPAAVLSLRGLVPRPLHRLPLGWVLAIAAIAAVQNAGGDRRIAAAVLVAGLTCLAVWSIAVAILAARGIAAPADAPAFRAQRAQARLADAIARLDRAERGLAGLVARFGSTGSSAGVWLAAASAIYVAVGLTIARGWLGGGQWFAVELAQLAAWFGLRPPERLGFPQLWWLLGPVWSLVLGGLAWGVATCFPRFDAGRLRPLRLAAIVFGLALLLWSVQVGRQLAEVRAAEERAMGIRH